MGRFGKPEEVGALAAYLASDEAAYITGEGAPPSMAASHTVTPISTRFPTDFLVRATLRRGTPGDAEACGHICYQAFKGIADEHNFPPDFPTPEVAVNVVGAMLAHPGFYSVVAEQGGRVVGSNFLDERCPIAGLGPITVDPAAQDARRWAATRGRCPRPCGVERGGRRPPRASGISWPLDGALHQVGIRNPRAARHGAGIADRRATPRMSCSSCSARRPPRMRRDSSANVHGHERLWDLRDAVGHGSARVVERGGHVTAYATLLGFAGHAVARANDDLKALIASADRIHNPGFLLPSRNHDLLRWCIEAGVAPEAAG